MKRLPGRLRAVFDCNTLIQALAFDGPAAACLELVETGRVELFMSKSTLAELRRVLAYDKVQTMSPNMTPVRASAFVQRLTFRSVFLRGIPQVLDYPRDHKDEPYINLAVAAHADFLVSRDKDLLSLMTGHSLVCKQFRRVSHPLRVIDPNGFLEAAGHPRRIR